MPTASEILKLWDGATANITPDAWLVLRDATDADKGRFLAALCSTIIDGEDVDADTLPETVRAAFILTVGRSKRSADNRRNGKKGAEARWGKKAVTDALESGQRASFDPPTPADVFDVVGHWPEASISCSEFCDHYGKQGWLLDSGRVPQSWSDNLAEYAEKHG